MRTNSLGQICQNHVDACHDLINRPKGKNWVLPLEDIMPSLPHLHTPEGYVFEAVYTENPSRCLSDNSIPYIRPAGLHPLNEFQWYRWSKNIPDGYYSPLEKMVGDCVPEAAWEAVLLDDLDRRLPMFQHACYCLITYITDLDEYMDTAWISRYVDKETGQPLEVRDVPVKELPFDHWKTPVFGYKSYDDIREAQKYLNDDSILPKAIRITDRTFEVEYCYWGNWSGLMKKRKKVRIEKDSIIIKELSCENLVKFDWGVRV